MTFCFLVILFILYLYFLFVKTHTHVDAHFPVGGGGGGWCRSQDHVTSSSGVKIPVLHVLYSVCDRTTVLFY